MLRHSPSPSSHLTGGSAASRNSHGSAARHRRTRTACCPARCPAWRSGSCRRAFDDVGGGAQQCIVTTLPLSSSYRRATRRRRTFTAPTTGPLLRVRGGAHHSSAPAFRHHPLPSPHQHTPSRCRGTTLRPSGRSASRPYRRPPFRRSQTSRTTPSPCLCSPVRLSVYLSVDLTTLCSEPPPSPL